MISYERDGDLWIVTINRPEKAGALSRKMLGDLADIVENATTCKALILTGTGKVFSAGADLDEAYAGLATDPLWERVSSAVAAVPGLTIAALNGTVAGGAFGMTLACDLRIAVPGAQFFYPVMRLGFRPPPSDPKRLKALIGPSRAKMILTAGQRISAQQAADWGLIDRMVPKDIVQEAKLLAKDALNAELSHINGIKQMI
ncbi:enoyl-CoA hydratase/isomerase family protein [Yoonia sp. BS5-3]|uniref:Enoyl-CoA hydratase/isomerase family protein n=1 Tax=Yoonia phaeophyticola TaxID=3137369 RepID=A0ABZ2V5R0_9RHOB